MAGTLILGGGGMIGQKLAATLPAGGLTLFDMAFPAGGVAARQVVGNVTDAAAIRALIADRPDPIYHLAAVVSGEAEANFALGWEVNMFPMWHLLEAIRAEHDASGGRYCPRLVFTSSIAVFGGPYPDRIGDDFTPAPQTSYGAQKLICETMLADFTRKGFVDGIAIRLPTVCVRPGRPNKAASGFFSGIIREPLNGQRAVLPVADTVRHWHASPRSAARFLTHAATMDTGLLEGRIALNMPGFSCTVGEQIEALRAIAGNDVVGLIDRVPDETVMRIVDGWPRNFAPNRAAALGFTAEAGFETIIHIYIEDDLRH